MVVSRAARGFLLLLCLSLTPFPAAAADPPSAAVPSDDAEAADGAETAAAPSAAATEHHEALTFDPATVGLPELPQPMRSTDDFQQTLDLIDVRLTEQEAALAATEAGAAEVAALADEPAGDPADEVLMEAADLAAEDGALGARAALLTSRIELLRDLRLTVQRRATLSERFEQFAGEIEQAREQLGAIERDGIGLEPPFLVSLLDQAQAELALRQATADVAETRIETARRRAAAAERALNAAVRERRAARDRLTASSDAEEAEREALEQALEVKRLQELLARQNRAAAEDAVASAQQQDELAQARESVLAARVRALEGRVVLPRAALEQRLAELTAREDAMREELEGLERQGDAAEAALFRARERLAATDTGTDTEAQRRDLEAWVEARETEQSAARASVDSVALAMANLAEQRRLWELRYQFMNDPEAADLPALLRQVINTAATVRAEQTDVEGRLGALRSIQLAQARRLDDPSLSDGMLEAFAARTAAHDLAEGHGRALLETQDGLVALLEGMRRQLEAEVQDRDISLQLLQAQETLANWWEAELLVIGDHGIRLGELLAALAMFVAVLIATSLIRFGARRALQRRRAKSSQAQLGDLRLALSAIAGSTNQVFVLIAAFFVAMVFSGLASPTVKSWLWTLLVIAFYAQLGIWANAAMVDYFNRKRTRQEMRDPSTVTGYGVMMVFIRVGIWVTVVVSLLAYFNYPIAGLLGALGIGSVAVGFALQSILGDVFSSMAIILDKPFRVGDFVMSGDTLGVIEHIGVKTTRIRSLSGEQIVLSNSDLLGSRIHNFKHFKERRIVFRIGVVYDTPRLLLERIPGMLREAVEEQPHTRFDRAHFFEFGDYALTFEVVYYVLSPDYALYMDIQQGMNFGIHRRFEEAGISFAYPTQELILRRGPALANAEA